MFLIDPEGRRHAALPPTPGVATAAAIGGRDLEHAENAVRDFGFVEVADVRDGVQVRMRPLLVSGPAATQVFFALADMRPPRVVIVRYDDDRGQWRHEICGHWRKALDRMNALVFANERLPGYTATELDLAEIDTLRDEGLSELRRSWECGDRCLAAVGPASFAAFAAARHSVLVAADAEQACLRILGLGSLIQLYGADWNEAARGKDLAEQPDALFAARVIANLRRAIALDRPLFHRVEAVVRRSARNAVQLSYRRLVLPWRLEDGRRAASSTILLDQFIEIAR